MIRKRTTNTRGEPYRDGRPRYEARVRGPDGKLALRTFTTMKAAQAWERDKYAEKDHGAWVVQSGGRVVARQLEGTTRSPVAWDRVGVGSGPASG